MTSPFSWSVQVTCFQRSCCAPCSGRGLDCRRDCRPQVCFLLGSRGSVDGRTSDVCWRAEVQARCISAPRWLAKPGDACVALPKTLVTWSLPPPLARTPRKWPIAVMCLVTTSHFLHFVLTKLSLIPKPYSPLGQVELTGARPVHPHSQEGHSGRHPFQGRAGSIGSIVSVCRLYL